MMTKNSGTLQLHSGEISASELRMDMYDTTMTFCGKVTVMNVNEVEGGAKDRSV